METKEEIDKRFKGLKIAKRRPRPTGFGQVGDSTVRLDNGYEFFLGDCKEDNKGPYNVKFGYYIQDKITKEFEVRYLENYTESYIHQEKRIDRGRDWILEDKSGEKIWLIFRKQSGDDQFIYHFACWETNFQEGNFNKIFSCDKEMKNEVKIVSIEDRNLYIECCDGKILFEDFNKDQFFQLNHTISGFENFTKNIFLQFCDTSPVEFSWNIWFPKKFFQQKRLYNEKIEDVITSLPNTNNPFLSVSNFLAGLSRHNYSVVNALGIDKAIEMNTLLVNTIENMIENLNTRDDLNDFREYVLPYFNENSLLYQKLERKEEAFNSKENDFRYF